MSTEPLKSELSALENGITTDEKGKVYLSAVAEEMIKTIKPRELNWNPKDRAGQSSYSSPTSEDYSNALKDHIYFLRNRIEVHDAQMAEKDKQIAEKDIQISEFQRQIRELTEALISANKAALPQSPPVFEILTIQDPIKEDTTKNVTEKENPPVRQAAIIENNETPFIVSKAPLKNARIDSPYVIMPKPKNYESIAPIIKPIEDSFYFHPVKNNSVDKQSEIKGESKVKKGFLRGLFSVI